MQSYNNTSNFLNYLWYGLVALSTTYVAVFVPIKLIFNESYLAPIFYHFDTLTYAVFAIDMGISYYKRWRLEKKGEHEETYQYSHYSLKWQVADIISIIPFGLLFGISWLDFVRLSKIFKVTLYYKLIRFQEVKYFNTIKLAYFIYWTVIFAHWISCAWIQLRGIDSSVNDYSNYIKALYWAVTTLTTIGYGDITPVGDQQMLFTMFVQILGVGLYGYIIGSAASIISNTDPAKTKYIENIERLNALVNYREVPEATQRKLRNYYTYLWEKKMGFNESNFLNDLPPTLKKEVALFLKEDAVMKIPLFKGANDLFIDELALCLDPVVMLPGDVLMRAGEIGEEMYFIVRGRMDVLVPPNNHHVATLKDGDFFGEIALFMEKPRTATMRAATFCDLYRLKKDDLNRVFERYPEMAYSIRKKAEEREAENQQQQKSS